MSQDELVRAFTDGRVTRRAFVRQLVEGGMPMPAALSYADSLAPPAGGPAPEPAPAPQPTTRGTIPAKPVQVDGLEVNFVGDGYIVYHPARDRMHSLNHTAAVVLELCTGDNDEAEIARLLQQAFSLDAPPAAETRECLAVLFDEGLIR